MPDLIGLQKLIDKTVDDFNKTKNELCFCLKWIDSKFKEGDRITERDYQEFLDGIRKIK